ncbi:hypothetical protein L615_000100001120 [Nocardioides sp. J9]|uniref:serine/threonine protein kinase n=1 Tax=Nocardioides sp. J9 TaxID=935844 RepID=UPI0011A299DB|nr:serine/threonine protein kinase [Nocardioides sp. J9]TWH04957.1 hypothetical protein L615_000100001120 [Nocardioides sp. J9]
MRTTSRLTRVLTAVAGGLTAVALAACGTSPVPEEARVHEDDAALDLPVALRPAGEGQRSVMWVGNNWDGTASIVDARTLEVLKRGVDLIPDKAEETNRILRDPVALVFYLAINAGPGQGHNQYVDDMFTTMDGKYLAVSRPSFADVVWIDIARATAGRTDSIVREQQMDGYRTDHMQVSNDGTRLLVSDSTARQVIEYSMIDGTLDGKSVRVGDRLRTFPSGETPHESNYTEDGERILHASIGRVYTPLDDLDPADGDLLGLPLDKLNLGGLLGGLPGLGNLGNLGNLVNLLSLDKLLGTLPWSKLEAAVKADRWMQYVDAGTFEVLQRWDLGKELAEAGHPGMSSAVRPVAVHPDGRLLYLQVSFLHGYVVFDTEAADLNGTTDYTLGGMPEPAKGAVVDVVELENRVPTMMREAYVNDSAHHGIAISGDGRTLCVAGTMDDYAALVDAETGEATYFDEETTGHGYGKPYWSTEGLDDTCWVSLSDDDAVAVLSTRTGEELAYLEVGNHPQRVRHGYVPESVVATW